MTPARAAAEYLAITIARRNGWTTREAERLAALTGLDVPTASRLTRTRDLAELRARRRDLDAYTTGIRQGNQ